jgi:hypothetical protein
LPNGTAGSTSTVGSTYAATLTASGGTSPYTWSLAAGSSLPAGLTLNPHGTITGIPTTVGTSTVSVQVTDSGSPAQTATVQLTLAVNPPPLAITTTGPLPAATVGSAYAASLAASGGTSPYTWSLAAGSSLPAGLTLNPDGTITGTPTTAGTVNPTVQVTDSATPSPLTTTKTLSITVAPPPPAVTAMTPQSGGTSSLVVIHGTNLTPPGTTCTLWSFRNCAVTVDFGTRTAFVIYASPTLIVAIAPPGTGTVDVTVTAAGRTSATGPADRYTYISQGRGDDNESRSRHER